MELEIIRLIIIGDSDGAAQIIAGMLPNELVSYRDMLIEAQNLVEDRIRQINGASDFESVWQTKNGINKRIA